MGETLKAAFRYLVVSDDGLFMAFQVPRLELAAGAGQGIYMLDLRSAGFRQLKQRYRVRKSKG